MKYCSICGYPLTDDMTFCPQCGAPAGEQNPQIVQSKNSALKTAAKILMLISCIGTCLLGILLGYTELIALAWEIPMTVHYWRAVAGRVPVGTGFKICTLLFVNLIAGILMLCDSERSQNS